MATVRIEGWTFTVPATDKVIGWRWRPEHGNFLVTVLAADGKPYGIVCETREGVSEVLDEFGQLHPHIAERAS